MHGGIFRWLAGTLRGAERAGERYRHAFLRSRHRACDSRNFPNQCSQNHACIENVGRSQSCMLSFIGNDWNPRREAGTRDGLYTLARTGRLASVPTQQHTSEPCNCAHARHRQNPVTTELTSARAQRSGSSLGRRATVSLRAAAAQTARSQHSRLRIRVCFVFVCCFVLRLFVQNPCMTEISVRKLRQIRRMKLGIQACTTEIHIARTVSGHARAGVRREELGHVLVVRRPPVAEPRLQLLH